MKKIIFFMIVLLCFAVIPMASCGEKLPTRTLNVYNWGEYISDGSEETYNTNAEFEEYFNKNLAEKYGYKIKVNYTNYSTNEDMYSKLSSGAGQGVYDVIFPSDYMLQRMIDEDMLYEFKNGVEAEIENYKYISNEFRGLFYDPEEKYSIPYTYGMVGIIYNPTMMDPEDIDQETGEIKEKSWALLWNDQSIYHGDYSGKILQFNNPRDAFGTAMYYQGADINTADRSIWEEAKQKLVEQKAILQGYVNDEIYNKMESESAVIAPYFAGDYVTMAWENSNLRFYYPEEGTNIFVDAMCIPKSSKNIDAAKEYINFMLSEEPAINNAEYIGYASPNKLVYENEDYKASMSEPFVDDNEKPIPGMATAYDILYVSLDKNSPDYVNINYRDDNGNLIDPYYHSFSNAEIYGDDMQFYVNSLWEDLKTSTAVEPWVHIASISIVVVLLTLCSYSMITKRVRSRFYRKRDREKAKETAKLMQQ